MWNAWGHCSATCGQGLQRRNRICDNPKPAHNGDYCEGDELKYSLCTVEECDVGKYIHIIKFMDVTSSVPESSLVKQWKG